MYTCSSIHLVSDGGAIREDGVVYGVVDDGVESLLLQLVFRVLCFSNSTRATSRLLGLYHGDIWGMFRSSSVVWCIGWFFTLCDHPSRAASLFGHSGQGVVFVCHHSAGMCICLCTECLACLGGLGLAQC